MVRKFLAAVPKVRAYTTHSVAFLPASARQRITAAVKDRRFEADAFPFSTPSAHNYAEAPPTI
jgi:hypothetical protein